MNPDHSNFFLKGFQLLWSTYHQTTTPFSVISHIHQRVKQMLSVSFSFFLLRLFKKSLKDKDYFYFNIVNISHFSSCLLSLSHFFSCFLIHTFMVGWFVLGNKVPHYIWFIFLFSLLKSGTIPLHLFVCLFKKPSHLFFWISHIPLFASLWYDYM